MVVDDAVAVAYIDFRRVNREEEDEKKEETKVVVKIAENRVCGSLALSKQFVKCWFKKWVILEIQAKIGEIS